MSPFVVVSPPCSLLSSKGLNLAIKDLKVTELKFETWVKEIRAIQELDVLKVLRRKSVKAITLDEFKELLEKAQG